MQSNLFYGRQTSRLPNAAMPLPELPAASEDEVDLLREQEFDDRPVSNASVRTPSRKHPLDLTLQQRGSKSLPESPSSTSSRSRLEIVLAATPKPSLFPQPPDSHSQNLQDLVTSDLAPRSHRKANMIPCGITKPESSLQSGSPAAIATPRPTEEPMKRKRGRPKGWKAGTTYDGKPLTPAEKLQRAERRQNKTPPNYVLKKRRGRRPKRPSPTPQDIFHKICPKFIPFSCEWCNCKAELQNMATLRRHVMVVHHQSEICQWGKCAKRKTPVKLGIGDQFEDHMEKHHLVPYEWHMGDGYQNTILMPAEDSENIPPYLFDKDGNQVTPSIKDQQVEDHETWKKNRRRLRELLIQRDANAPFEEDSPIDSD